MGKRLCPGQSSSLITPTTKGLYHAAGKTGWRLHGWALTDAEGRFEFTTIRPAPYPGRTIPAHVHLSVEGAGVPRQWTDELRFADDPLLSAEERATSEKAGTFGGVRPIQREGDAQVVEFNIRTKAKKDF